MALSRDQVVVLGMFDIVAADSARAVRIRSLYEALARCVPTTLIAGTRNQRRRAIARFILEGGMRRMRALYVEAGNGPAAECDLALLMLARTAGIPVIAYLPDAYQRFPDLFPASGPKALLLRWGWEVSVGLYTRFCDLLLFPSAGLARVFDTRRATGLLPPGGVIGRERHEAPRHPPCVVYVGASSHRYGTDMLLDAMDMVSGVIGEVRCRIVTPDAGFIARHRHRDAHWLRVERLRFDALAEVMRDATVGVIALRANEYNALAVPVKLFDYLSFGCPVVVTDCAATARFVRDTGSGLVVDANSEALARGLLRMLSDTALAERCAANAYRAVQTTHGWPHRARELLAHIDRLAERRVR
ncbi:MAG: glycosyltransferase family 4 protein [Gammaproteobacteria bacterium]